MTHDQIRRIIMAAETTTAVKSKSLWGNLLTTLGIIEEATQIVATSGVVPPHAGLILALIGNLLAFLGRLNPDIKPVSGVLN